MLVCGYNMVLALESTVTVAKTWGPEDKSWRRTVGGEERMWTSPSMMADIATQSGETGHFAETIAVGDGACWMCDGSKSTAHAEDVIRGR